MHPVSDWTEITITSRCNQRCFFCYEEARSKEPDPTAEEVRRLIRETRARSEQIVFCGREAMLRPDIFGLVAYASRLGLKPVIFTNGQALARAGIAARLAEAGCSGVAVSFHFPDAATFAAGARVSPRMFARVLAGLRNLGEHNRAHPDRAMGLSVEIDMFSLNAGRLDEMRRTLLDALGDTGWSLRLASLLPIWVHDIGLPSVVDSMDARRDEVAALVRSQPPGVGLGFVKVPLCLLPEGEEHRCLDVQYVQRGTRMSFNHLHSDRIEEDRASVTQAREIDTGLRRSPYRWLCRSCAVLPMCRFERTSWTTPGFLPDRANRPRPYHPDAEDLSGAAGLGLPRRTRSAADVLAPLGAEPVALAAIAAACRAARAQEFPEEAILGALRAAPRGAPALVDAWSEREPVLAIALELGGRRLHLSLAAPGTQAEESCALVDYLAVRPLRGEDAQAELMLPALRHLAVLPLPEISRWAGDGWFHAPAAEARRKAWRLLGEALWPGLGGLGPWRCSSVRSSAAIGVAVRLEHAGGAQAELTFRAGQDGQVAPVDLTLDGLGPTTPPADVHGLLACLLRRATGQARRVPRLPATAASWTLQLRADGWTRATAAPAAHAAPAEDEIVLWVQRGATPIAELHAIRARPGRPVYRGVGRLALWHGQERLEGAAEAWAGLMLVAMSRHAEDELCAAAVPRWRETLGELVRNAPWTRGFAWRLEWRTAARTRVEGAPRG